MSDLERIPFRIRPQPDDVSCGPACLEAVYGFYDDVVDFDELRSEIPSMDEGGTLTALLGVHALERGYRAELHSWNLQVLDPTWGGLAPLELRDKLVARADARPERRLLLALEAHARFLECGGDVRFGDLEADLLRHHLSQGRPVLCSLSATYLYQEPREIPSTNRPDDIAGDPSGHFVVLTGYSPTTEEILVSDPLYPNPMSRAHTYAVRIERVVGALFLGVLTHDAELLVLEPPRGEHDAHAGRRRR